jgi:nitric oxide dioxygenase
LQNLITREDCRLVQVSFAEIEPIADRVAVAFYRRLFELKPTLAPLFKKTMEQQAAVFMETLAVAVVGLDDLDSIAPLVRSLGRGHAGYGIQPADYEMAREALLWAFGDALGSTFTPELCGAWTAAFDTIAAEMIRVSGESH